MKDLIITGFSNPTKEGVNLHLNKKGRLKTGTLTSETFYVSWDKIGQNLFEDYTELTEVNDRRLLRYVTNLLYAATNEGPAMNSIQFDKWVDEQISELKEYHTQFQVTHEHYMRFVEWLLTETNYPLLFGEINSESTKKHYAHWLENIDNK
jgi:hypothetical protein